jgi:hypothetical protein
MQEKERGGGRGESGELSEVYCGPTLHKTPRFRAENGVGGGVGWGEGMIRLGRDNAEYNEEE